MRKEYKVKFTVKGKVEIQEEIINVPVGAIKSDNDAKSYLLPYEYDVDEILSCREQRDN